MQMNTIQIHKDSQNLLMHSKPFSNANLKSPETKICHKKQIQNKDQVQSKQIVHQILWLSKLRRDSAFSIYEPENNEEGSQIQSCSSSLIECQEDQSLKNKMIKKDKKQPKKTKVSRLETKNLNRYFRSKINQLLREIKEHHPNQEDRNKAKKILQSLNDSNRIMFSQIRQIIKDPWLHTKLKRCSGALLRYIHAGKMGMSSKLIMLKYFNRIMKAIQNPQKFTCWK